MAKYTANATATTHISGWMVRTRPETVRSTTKLMNPAPMPLAIEYVKGITTIVRKAGSATEKSSNAMSLICAIINTPTTTSAGAAASTGTTWYSGVKNIATMNSNPVTTFARPVRAPSAMPAADSMYTVLELLDAAPPPIAPSDSTNSVRPIPGSWPSSSSRPASLPRPVNVPTASKKSVSTRVNTSNTAVIAGTRAHAPNEKSPSNDRSGRLNTLSGRPG